MRIMMLVVVAVILLIPGSAPAQTMYSDAWSDGELFLDAVDPSVPVYGVGVTDDSQYAYGYVQADATLFDANGAVLDSEAGEGWYYADAYLFADIAATVVTPPENCALVRHRFWENDIGRWTLLSTSRSIVHFSRAAVRWRYLGVVGDGYHDYGPDDCITPCLVNGRHLYYSIYRGTYIRGFGWAVYFWGRWSCRIRLEGSETRGECWGPS